MQPWLYLYNFKENICFPIAGYGKSTIPITSKLSEGVAVMTLDPRLITKALLNNCLVLFRMKIVI